jgi:hypothetical protein
MTCTPTGSLATPIITPAYCHCGATIRAVPWGDSDWLWADKDGRTRVSHVNEIYDELRRCHAVVLDPDAHLDDPVVIADVGRYSLLSAALAVGHGIDLGHGHTPMRGGRSLTAPPWCCGDPMQAVPAGWRCRITGSVHPYDDLFGNIPIYTN